MHKSLFYIIHHRNANEKRNRKFKRENTYYENEKRRFAPLFVYSHKPTVFIHHGNFFMRVHRKTKRKILIKSNGL